MSNTYNNWLQIYNSTEWINNYLQGGFKLIFSSIYWHVITVRQNMTKY